MPNFCHECGGQVPEQAKFCGNCGESIEGSATSEPRSNSGSQSIEIVHQPRSSPAPMLIEQPIRYYESVSGSTHHSQDFRDKTGFFDTFQQSLGSNFGGCIGQFMGCLGVLALILVGLAFIGAFANNSEGYQVHPEPDSKVEAAQSVVPEETQTAEPKSGPHVWTDEELEGLRRHDPSVGIGTDYPVLSMMEEETWAQSDKPKLASNFWKIRFPSDDSILECESMINKPHSFQIYRDLESKTLTVMRYDNNQRADEVRLRINKDGTGFSGDSGEFGSYEVFPKGNATFLKVEDQGLFIGCRKMS